MLTLSLLLLGSLQTSPEFDSADAWAKVDRAVRSTYYARLRDKDRMERILSAAAPGARGAKGRDEFQVRVRAMIAEFGDSHFDLLTRSDQGFYPFDQLVRREKAVPMPHVGAWFRPTGDGVTVAMVLDGGEADKAGLRKGDVVMTVDGEPFSPVDSLRARVGREVTLGYRRGNRDATARVKVAEQPAIDAFLDGSRRSGRIIERDGLKVGYFRLWVMVDDRLRTALHNFVYGPARQTDAFVLDLRDGFGGRPEGFADPFFRPEVELGWGMGGQTVTQLFGYQRPLVVIVNRGSRSAKEVLALILKKSGRATLVGETTAGDVLGTSPTPLGDWAYLEVPMVDLEVDGERLEGVGVPPHVAVGREFDEDGNDAMLERAVDVAIEKATAARRSGS